MVLSPMQMRKNRLGGGLMRSLNLNPKKIIVCSTTAESIVSPLCINKGIPKVCSPHPQAHGVTVAVIAAIQDAVIGTIEENFPPDNHYTPVDDSEGYGRTVDDDQINKDSMDEGWS